MLPHEAGSRLMNSTRVASGHVSLANIANPLCFSILFETRGLRLSNLDGGRNSGKHYFCSVNSMKSRIRNVATLGNRKFALPARTRAQVLRSVASASSRNAGRGWLSLFTRLERNMCFCFFQIPNGNHTLSIQVCKLHTCTCEKLIFCVASVVVYVSARVRSAAPTLRPSYSSKEINDYENGTHKTSNDLRGTRFT